VALGARDVHALAGTEHTGPYDAAADVVAVDSFDDQHDRAVGEEHLVTDAHPAGEVVGWLWRLRCSSPSICSAVSTTSLSMRSSTSSSADGPVRSLGPGEIHEDAHRPVQRARSRAAVAACSACNSGVGVTPRS